MNWSKFCIFAAAPAAYYFSNHKNSISDQFNHELSFRAKKFAAEKAIKRYMLFNGVPGVSVGVSIDGKTIWRSGIGFSDVEQCVPCTGDTLMRIASISKSITAVITAQLVEEGKLDVDAPIQNYVPSFPMKKFENEDVKITCRQLLAHISGIRHYKSTDSKNDANSDEFFLNNEYENISDSLKIFQDDDLQAKPGSKYIYTTFGYSLLSAVLEEASGKKFSTLLMELTRKLGMTSTRFDKNSDIIPNRARYYNFNKSGKLENVPEVNCSYKWAGGGLLSNVADLLVFGNSLLYNYQYQPNPNTSCKPLLKPETMEKLWTAEIQSSTNSNEQYCWGWFGQPKIEKIGGGAPNRTGYYFHTGGAVGASSILLIRPKSQNLENDQPAGTCVAILANMQSAGSGIIQLALEISEIFSNELKKP